jgi:hypothetical protein
MTYKIKDALDANKDFASTVEADVHTPHHRDPEAIAALGAIGAKTGGRAYGTAVRIAVGLASEDSDAIVATEVLLHASVRCFVKAGETPTAVPDGDSIPLEAGEKFHMRITSGDKIAVIRDTADGFLHIAPVV